MNLGKEDELNEFKESLTQLDKGLISLSAMLNRHNRGTVYFGVSDNGDTHNVPIGDDTFDKIRERIHQQISPQVTADIASHHDEMGNTYVSVHAEGFDIPYSCDGRYYVRVAASNEQASANVLREMLLSGNRDVTRCMESPIQELTFEQLGRVLERRGIHVRDERGFESSLGLLDRNGHYNIVAYLLSDQNNIAMQVVRFSGKDKATMSERTDHGHRCLVSSIGHILDQISSLNVTQVDLSTRMRIDRHMFDIDSFNEAFLNACVHNDWKNMIPPSVFVFDDRIEIQSYGDIPFGLDEEDFYNGTSMPVNMTLFAIFARAGLTEQSGHGIPVIVSNYGRNCIRRNGGVFTVTIPFSFTPGYVSARKASDLGIDDLSKGQKAVLSVLQNNPQASIREISEVTGLSESGIKKMISAMKSDLVIERVGSARKGSWKIMI